MDKIRVEDIPGEYQDIVDDLGLENFLKLCRLCGGQDLYVPKIESLMREGRNRDIRSRFDGANYRIIARQFRLSERQIRTIINGKKHRRT